MYFLYSALLAMALVLSLPYWLLEMLRHGKYRAGWSERLGRVPRRIKSDRPQDVIWIHAVSVGEVLAISQLVERLYAALPHCRIVVSTTTDSGQRLARQRFGAENVFYVPLDFRFAIQPYMRILRPALLVIAETEFWPNLLHCAATRGSGVAVVNARISDRSLPGYLRWRKPLAGVLNDVDLFLSQTPTDATRLQQIGAPRNRIRTAGNLKYDMPKPMLAPVVEQLREMFHHSGAGPVIVCGSTVAGEEALLLKAFEHVLVIYRQAVMILAPRRPERFNEVGELLTELRIPFRKRSQWNGETLSGGVLLLDSIGELASIYSLADIAFVGGSLEPFGGHNILEPAQHGVATVVGNHTANFRDMVQLFQSRDALRIVGPAELPLVWMELLADPQQRLTLGGNAAATLQSQTGATDITLKALLDLLPQRPHHFSAEVGHATQL